jgi:phosphoserine phosphatase
MSVRRTSISLVIFDMDGVIFEGRNFWLDLHRRYGTEAQALDLARQSLRSDYEALARYTVEELWKGRPAEPLLQLVAMRRYQPGIAEACQFLRAQRRLKTAIVSSGPIQLAERAQRDLGIDEIRANRVIIEDGRISGGVVVAVSDAGKLPVGLQVIARLGGAPDRTAFIGDSESDAALAGAVALSIAYDSDSDVLDRAAKHHLRRGELAKLVDLI